MNSNEAVSVPSKSTTSFAQGDTSPNHTKRDPKGSPPIPIQTSEQPATNQCSPPAIPYSPSSYFLFGNQAAPIEATLESSHR